MASTKGTLNDITNPQGMQVFDPRNEMKKLEHALKSIEPILEDAEQKQLGDEEVCDFLGRLRNLVYDIEDVLDGLLLHIKQENINQKGDTAQVYSSLTPTFGYAFNTCFSSIHEVCSSLTSTLGDASNYCVILGKVKNIISLRKQLEKLNVESLKYDLTKTVRVLPEDSCKQSYGNFCDDDVIYGRDLDKQIIMKKLFESNSVGNREVTGVKVVSVVGIGGIGKTTLARYVYNHDKVRSHFQTRLWVSVPQTPASYLKTTVLGILKGLSTSGDDDTSFGTFQSADIGYLMSLLFNRIKQKKFLLVLDDVWDDNIGKWQSLKKSLNNGLPGSSILILTRNKRAAYLMSTTTLHELKPLSNEFAWKLFQRNAFAKQDDGGGASKPFEDIGRIVSQRCDGVPLALKCLGGLLRTKETTQEWEDILESDTWELLEMEPILPALYFSYYSLPPVLKLCLSYTAIFPKAYEIEKGILIKLWMAEGFLSSFATKDKDPELIGAECFRELMMRSYFSPHQTNKDGEVTCIKMHDLVHDLAASMSGHSVVEIDNAPFNMDKARHLSVLHSDMDSITSSLRKENHVSTLKLVECRMLSETVSPNVFANLIFLRVLDLSYHDFTEIPNEVGKLKHLRYLNLSHTKVQSLPEGLCDLQNLQTLTLNECEDLRKLPESLGNLSGLRHLEIQSTPKLLYLPQGIGRLTSLRTLSKFQVNILKPGGRIGELKNLNKLHGYINIIGLHTVKNLKEASEAKLMNKKNLQELRLDFSPGKLENIGEDELRKTEDVLEDLHPHRNIKKMTLTHFLGSKLPRWLENDLLLPNLCSLKIQDCMNCKKLPALGRLPSLEELHIQNLDSVKDIGNEFYGIGSNRKYMKEVAFPRLEELHLVDMAILELWDFTAQTDEKIMPCLRVLHVQNCPKLIVLPHFFSNTMKKPYVRRCAKLASSTLDKFS